MVGLNKEKTLFNYRVAGVAINNGHILLDRNTRNSYWVLPGGHPDMMEPMQDALAREIKEEIDEDIEVVRLLWVLENFFHKKNDVHELRLYFLMKLHDHSKLLKSKGPFYGEEHGRALIYQWFPLDEGILSTLPLYPSNLASALIDIPSYPQHIVFKDFGPVKKQEETGKQRLTIS
jgi:ADP-ribose pyrophosphatase YjhB (NUDIX family)